MGNIGTPEILIVVIVALLVLGPQRLPQAARQVGKAMAEFRRVTGGLQAEMRDAMSSIESEIKSSTEASSAAPQPAKPAIFEPPAVGPAPGTPGAGMIAPLPEMTVPETPDTQPEAAPPATSSEPASTQAAPPATSSEGDPAPGA